MISFIFVMKVIVKDGKKCFRHSKLKCQELQKPSRIFDHDNVKSEWVKGTFIAILQN